eukprot:4467476-Pleurochrysis_carterae.AAC.2
MTLRVCAPHVRESQQVMKSCTVTASHRWQCVRQRHATTETVLMKELQATIALPMLKQLLVEMQPQRLQATSTHAPSATPAGGGPPEAGQLRSVQHNDHDGAQDGAQKPMLPSSQKPTQESARGRSHDSPRGAAQSALANANTEGGARSSAGRSVSCQDGGRRDDADDASREVGCGDAGHAT